ncbi:DUF5949 family protein [Streptomyces litmocidini]|uniref:DUF5949 family protein n=1 Tax=Streptomyces litmocidini TaxID=67318 RepID=UPI0036FA7ECD
MVMHPSIQGTPVTARLDGDIVTVSGFPGLPITRPTSPEWAAVARKRGEIFVSLTIRTWPEGPAAGERDTWKFVESDETIGNAVSMLIPLT